MFLPKLKIIKYSGSSHTVYSPYTLFKLPSQIDGMLHCSYQFLPTNPRMDSRAWEANHPKTSMLARISTALLRNRGVKSFMHVVISFSVFLYTICMAATNVSAGYMHVLFKHSRFYNALEALIIFLPCTGILVIVLYLSLLMWSSFESTNSMTPQEKTGPSSYTGMSVPSLQICSPSQDSCVFYFYLMNVMIGLVATGVCVGR